jgi:hypothetical protein
MQDKGQGGEIIAEEATVLKGSGKARRVISVLVGGRGKQYGMWRVVYTKNCIPHIKPKQFLLCKI